tara:strand:+ start:901 stop:1113 length:213 start_codon:yes stop_codon:yes gene_type:complete
MNNTTTYPVVSVPFKGGFYMCVAGSKRANVLERANRAWVMGYDELCADLYTEALQSPGCAFEARENSRRD